MRKLFPFIISAFLIVSTSLAQAPAPAPLPPVQPTFSIAGSVSVPEYNLAQIYLTSSPPGAPFKAAWLVIPNVSQYSSEDTLVFTAVPGSYTVIALAVSNNTPIILKTIVNITPATPPPVPPAPPTPPGPPIPPVPPPVGPFWSLGIFDTSDQQNLTPSQIAIYGSSTLGPALKGIGVKWRHYDVNDQVPVKGDGMVELKSTTWGKAADKVGLPALVVVDGTGAVLGARKLPDTEAEIVEETKKIKK